MARVSQQERKTLDAAADFIDATGVLAGDITGEEFAKQLWESHDGTRCVQAAELGGIALGQIRALNPAERSSLASSVGGHLAGERRESLIGALAEELGCSDLSVYASTAAMGLVMASHAYVNGEGRSAPHAAGIEALRMTEKALQSTLEVDEPSSL